MKRIGFAAPFGKQPRGNHRSAHRDDRRQCQYGVREAASTGKPVHVVPLDGGSDKLRRFHDGLVEDGITRPFHGTLESSLSTMPGWSPRG